MSYRSSALFFLLFLTLGLFVLMGGLLTGEQSLYYRDILHNYEPQLAYMQQSLQRGELPLWHTGISGGSPLVPGLEPPLFYPGTWLFFIGLTFPIALGLNLLLHHLVAGLGMYWVGYKLNWHPFSAMIAAIAFSLSGVLLSMNNLHPLLNTVVWLPWLFGFSHLLLFNPRPRFVAGFGLVYGLQILSGHLEIVYAESLLILAYGVYRLLLNTRDTKPALAYKTMLLCLSAVLLGIMLGCIQLMPSLYFIPISSRDTGVSLAIAQSWSWQPLLMSLFILPDIQGNAFHLASLHSIFGDLNFGYAALFYSAYQGVPLFLLSILSLYHRKNSPYTSLFYFSALAAVFSGLLAMGQYTPLYGLVYEWLPGASFFRYPSKWLVFTSFFLALLSGLGTESLLRNPLTENQSLKKSFFISCFGLVFAFCILYVFAHHKILLPWIQHFRPDTSETGAIHLSNSIGTALKHQVIYGLILTALSIVCVAWWFKRSEIKIIGLLGLLITLDLLSSGINVFWLGERQAFTTQPQSLTALKKIRAEDNSPSTTERFLVVETTDKKRHLPESFKPELKERVFFFWKTLFVYETLMQDLPLRWNEHVPFSGWPAKTRTMEMLGDLHLNALKVNQPAARNRIETAMAIRYLLFVNPTEAEAAFVKKSGHYQLRQELPEINSSIWENKNWQPRARFMSQAALVPDQDMALKTLIFPESGFDPAKQVVLEQNATLQAQLKAIPPQTPEQPRWTSPQITHESNQRLELAFETNQSGYLVLADQWTPGWRAWLNGKEVPILRANGFQRAIRVGPGQHQIRFEYTLPGFATGVLLTGLGLLLLLVLWFWPYKPTAPNDEAEIAIADAA